MTSIERNDWMMLCQCNLLLRDCQGIDQRMRSYKLGLGRLPFYSVLRRQDLDCHFASRRMTGRTPTQMCGIIGIFKHEVRPLLYVLHSYC